MRVDIFFIFLIIIPVYSCRTSENFNNESKYNNRFYLCYLYNSPEVVELQNISSKDSIISESFFSAKVYNISNYKLIKLRVKLIDFYLTKYAFEDYVKIMSALGDTCVKNREIFINRFENVYLFIKKGDTETINRINENFRRKNLMLFSFTYSNDEYKTFLSFDAYSVNKKTNFDKFILFDSIYISKYEPKTSQEKFGFMSNENTFALDIYDEADAKLFAAQNTNSPKFGLEKSLLKSFESDGIDGVADFLKERPSLIQYKDMYGERENVFKHLSSENKNKNIHSLFNSKGQSNNHSLIMQKPRMP